MKRKPPDLSIKYLVIALLLLCRPTVQAQQDQNLMEYLVQERPVLAGLLTKAGLTPMLSGQEQITLFAPSESALQSISQESPERLRAILSSHIVKGIYLEQDLKDGKPLKSICGTTNLNIYRKRDQTLVNGISIQRANLKVKNGVVHELSGIIRG